MAKRAKYEIEIGGEIAKFSNHRQSMLYAQFMSGRMPLITIQVIGKDGIAGQYVGGRPTKEFQPHHDAAFS